MASMLNPFQGSVMRSFYYPQVSPEAIFVKPLRGYVNGLLYNSKYTQKIILLSLRH